ncbi:hypothetical protein [Acidisarcina polymorpha]|nr:hypothetical protein [Acidisarcina polymorpha]
MILLTVFIALGTIASAIAVGFQWYEMHTGGADTKAIAEAAQKQACAAHQIAEASQRNATAAEEFATSAGLINRGVEDAVKKLQLQADQASRSADATKSAADTARETLRKSQRPWVNAESFVPTTFTLPPDGRFAVDGDLVIKNTGVSVATDGWVMMVAVPTATSWLTKNWDQACEIDDQQILASHTSAAKGLGDTWPIGFVLAPSQETRMRMAMGDVHGLIEAQITGALPHATSEQDPRSGQFYLLGCARYKDQFGTGHTTRFCFAYLNDRLSPSGFYVCNGLESAD